MTRLIGRARPCGLRAGGRPRSWWAWGGWGGGMAEGQAGKAEAAARLPHGTRGCALTDHWLGVAWAPGRRVGERCGGCIAILCRDGRVHGARAPAAARRAQWRPREAAPLYDLTRQLPVCAPLHCPRAPTTPAPPHPTPPPPRAASPSRTPTSCACPPPSPPHPRARPAPPASTPTLHTQMAGTSGGTSQPPSSSAQQQQQQSALLTRLMALDQLVLRVTEAMQASQS